jgi:flagellar biosynthesis protein FlhB
MADDRDPSQQTEEPTQRRLDQAHEHGDQVKSTELQTLLLLFGGTIVIAFFGQSSAMGLVGPLRMFLAQPDQIATDPGALMLLMRALLLKLAAVLGPAFALIMLFAVGSNLIQNRPSFTAERIKPDLAKLSLLKGLKRMFGFDGLSNLIKGILKILLVGVAIWTQVWPERAGLEALLSQNPGAVAADMMHLMFHMMIAALVALAVIAALDYAWQRHEFYKRNRMSKQEVKEEYKQTEGDPQVKARIRALRTERARRRMIAAVPKATVVITNPTHYAVALQYEQGKMAAPLCLAKGVDAIALRIREVAKAHNVPIVENPPLARALFAAVEIDETIPTEHYQAVAQVISYVLRITGKIKSS